VHHGRPPQERHGLLPGHPENLLAHAGNVVPFRYLEKIQFADSC
jgi:hypothetical protein